MSPRLFRGWRGGLIKVLWHNGQGMCLFALSVDTYTLDIGCRSGDSVSLDYIPSALQLEVGGPRDSASYCLSVRCRTINLVRLSSRWICNLEDSIDSSLSGRTITAAVWGLS
jgi:hypothetical protein